LIYNSWFSSIEYESPNCKNNNLLADDQSILVDFYNGLYSHGTLSWDTGSDLCGQTGVVCDGSNRVTELYFLFLFLFLFELLNY